MTREAIGAIFSGIQIGQQKRQAEPASQETTGMNQLRTIGLEHLSQDPNNAKLHTANDVAAIAKSLEAFGQQTPIVIKAIVTIEGHPPFRIIKGNGTYLAAKKLGWASITVIETDLPDSRIAEYAVADNQTATLSEWNMERLEQQISQLAEYRTDLGFSDAELDQILNHGVPVESPTVTIPSPDHFDAYSVRVAGIDPDHTQQLLALINARLRESGMSLVATAE